MVIQDINPRYSELVNSLKHKDKIRVLFVCLGNICRSPAAEGVMQELVEEKGAQDHWVIDSAGTGGWHVGQLPDVRMRTHARRRGLELTHRCRQVGVSDFDDFDLIIGMDSANVDDLRALAPTVEAEAKVMPMAEWFGDFSGYQSVPDPYYEGAEGFELVLDMLADATRNLYDTLS